MNINVIWFSEVLAEYDCLPETFWENVDDRQQVKKQILSAKTKQDIYDIVNNYI